GEGVMVVTFEFDQWRTWSGSQERDRLDVLGLDRKGRLVVAELKRDAAPDTVEMQALKYAAMASRFTVEELAAQHARYLARRGESVTPDEAKERLEAHCGFGLAAENLARPRIVLLASSFPPVVTATTVWLTEMGLEIDLIQLQAYRAGEDVVITVSQLYPVPDIEEFTVAPARSAKSASEQLPEIPWTKDDLAKLQDLANDTVRAALDLVSERPGDWIPLREVEARAARTYTQARADLAVLTMIVKRRFGRSNWPFAARWAAGGEPQLYYRMEPDLAAAWRELSTDRTSAADRAAAAPGWPAIALLGAAPCPEDRGSWAPALCGFRSDLSHAARAFSRAPRPGR